MSDLALQLKNMSHAPKDHAQVTQIQIDGPLWPSFQELDTTDTTGTTTDWRRTHIITTDPSR